MSNLALRSKGYWGYNAQFLNFCRTELTISPEYITTHPIFVLEEQSKIVGFYGLRGQGAEAELTHFFLEPGAIGCGYEKLL